MVQNEAMILLEIINLVMPIHRSPIVNLWIGESLEQCSTARSRLKLQILLITEIQHHLDQNIFPSSGHTLFLSPENGCLLVATKKLDGVRTFERTIVLLLRSGTRNPYEGPFGVVINRPLHKKMRNVSPTNVDLATTFADCSLHFGGPLDASMFLIRAGDTSGLTRFEEVIPGIYFGSRNTLDEASALIKEGVLRPQDFKFFVGYAGWQLDQLLDEIKSNYWYVVACSANLLSGVLQNSSSDGLWGEVLQLMGGHYSYLSRKPKQDF